MQVEKILPTFDSSNRNNMEQFKDQIEEIAAFAKRNGFNPETQFDALLKAWIKMTYERSIAFNKDKNAVLSIVKQFI